MSRNNTLLSCIGNTPIMRINNLRAEGAAEILVKLESRNVTGSVKVRAARNMLLKAEQTGDLKDGQPIVEPSSGNLGLALAMVCKEMGRKCYLIVDPRMTNFSESIMKSYDAEVIYVYNPDESGSWQGSRLRKAREVAKNINGYMCVQYSNPNNPDAHYHSTGVEIIKQLGQSPDICVAGLSTGGQVSGIGKRLKEYNYNMEMVAVDVRGSSIFGDKYVPYTLRGLGLSWWPKNLDIHTFDEAYQIPEEWAFYIARMLAKKEAIFSGGSAGAIFSVALKKAIQAGPGKQVLAILPERGDRYLDNFYSDSWLEEKNYTKDITLDEMFTYCNRLSPLSSEKMNEAYRYWGEKA